MDINIFDLSNYKVPYFYERKLSSFTYDLKEWKESINDFGKKTNFSMDEVPWGEKRDSDKSKRFKSNSSEFYTQEQLGSVPMHLKYNYHSDNTMSNNVIDFCWNEFIKQVNFTRKKYKLLGESDSFNSFLCFSYQDFNSKLIPIMPEYGFTNNPLFNIKKSYDNFKSGKRCPIFMDTIVDSKYKTLSLMPSVSFCEVLINYKYLSNSPIDVVFGGQKVNKHNIGDVNVPTLEDLSDYLINKLNFSKDNSFINVFIDRCDLLTWKTGVTTFDDKCYYVRDVKIFEKKDNYYKDLLNEIVSFKKIYETIINYKPNQEELNLEDCQTLLDQIVELK
jgi:hypothetical protein